MKISIALQLFTVRDETQKDFLGTLEKVAEMGYSGVEFAGFGNISSSEMDKTLKKLNLKAVGSHTIMDLLKNDLDEVIKYNLEIGNSFVVCPYDKYETKQEWLNAFDLYTEIGTKLKDRGLQFAYHNHSHEFEKYDDEYVLDMMYRSIDPELLKTEIDTCWAFYAGVDPAKYIGKYSGRCPIIHLKDLSKVDRDTTEVGEGIIDIKSIIKASKKAGTEWFVVEQDRCKRPTIESAKISIDNLKKMI